MKNKKFDVVYSLGFGCGMASSLKRLGLRMTSGPFDWIVGPDFEYRIELILNDFKDFFNKEDLVLNEKKSNDYQPEDPNRHTDTYKNLKNGFVHPHDFMEGDDFDATYPKVLEKYNRRIERFYEYLKDTNKRVLLTYLSFSVLDDKAIYDCYKKLVERFGNHISLLIFNHKTNLDYSTIEKRYLDENLVVYELNTVLYDEDGKLVVRSNRALIIPCLRKYKLDMTIKQIIANIYVKLLVKLSPLFIWDKKKRFEFRDKYKNRV
jgi:hypothetical protein